MLGIILFAAIAGGAFIISLAVFVGVCVHDKIKATPKAWEVSIVYGMRDVKSWQFKKKDGVLAQRFFLDVAGCPLAYILPQGTEKTEVCLYKEGKLYVKKTLFGGSYE